MHPLISPFVQLGRQLLHFLDQNHYETTDNEWQTFIDGLARASAKNQFYDTLYIHSALRGILTWLTEENLLAFTNHYHLSNLTISKNVLVITASNIPFVGFHDCLCVLLCGHRLLVKPSQNDGDLHILLLNLIAHCIPSLREKITIQKELIAIESFDAVIATGNNNSARYFEKYFGNYPHIIRKNRNSVAILKGDEDPTMLKALGKDIFSYYGLGCRNVTKIYIPEGYDLVHLLDQFQSFEFVSNNHAYMNNHTYQRAILAMNLEPYLDTGFLLVREHKDLYSPLATLHYEYYTGSAETILETLEQQQDQIQCIVSRFPQTVFFGNSQSPSLFDYADQVDTVQFLLQT